MSTKRRRALTLAAVALAALAMAALAAGCGDDDADEASAGPVDRAFAAEMIPHHEGAIQMAEIAKEKAEHPEVKRLSEDIVAAQSTEIRTLRMIEGELADKGIERGDLGLDEQSMGVDAHMSDLGNASPFDREFIAMMTAHHQGAIRMAQKEVADGRDSELRKIARDVIAAQSREIDQMARWSKRWYGGEVESDEHTSESESDSSSGHMDGM